MFLLKINRLTDLPKKTTTITGIKYQSIKLINRPSISSSPKSVNPNTESLGFNFSVKLL